MTEQSNIPGLHESGMFFEYYIFSPLSNFEETDIHHVLQFFDIQFSDESFIPETAKEHFNELVFKPKENLTVSQFADILKAMNIKLLDEKMLSKLPKQVQEHFNNERVFDPYDDFSINDLVKFLTGFVRFRISTEQFNTLPKKIQRQFLVYTRSGKSWRYGDRRPAA